MGRPKTKPDDDLLSVARRIFQAHGHAASTRDVAAAAGVSQAVLFQRFGSKDELFFRAMLPAPPDLDALLGEVAEAHAIGAERHLVEIAERLLAWLAASAPAMLHVMTHPAFPDPLVRAHRDAGAFELEPALADRLDALSARGMLGPVDTGAAAQAIVAGLHAMAVRDAMTGAGGNSDGQRVERLIGVLWSGLRPTS